MKKKTTSSFDPDAAAAASSGIFGLPSTPETAGVIVIPVPFDATTSYRPGTAGGPAAVLAASHQVDLHDSQYGAIHEPGIAMLPLPRHIVRLSAATRRRAAPVLEAGGADPGNARHRAIVAEVDRAGEAVNAWVRERAVEWLDRGRLVGVLGGDHSVPFGLIAELAHRHPGLGILHIDAHCDLREAYEGFRWSHASIFHQVMSELPGVARLVQVSVRDFGRRELEQIERSQGRIRTFFEADLRSVLSTGRSWDALVREILGGLPETVYISFDIDGLDPTLCPHTGTPVPGGMSFGEMTTLLAALAASGRRVVGFDLCEVVPAPRGDEWDQNVGARVLYKLIGASLTSLGKITPTRPRRGTGRRDRRTGR